MDWNTIAGNWNEAKGKVKSQWGKLTDDDLTYVEGKRDRLLGLLQQKYGLAKDKAEEQINQFASASEGWVAKAKDQVMKVKDQVADAVRDGKEYIQGTNVGDMAGDLRRMIEKNPLPAVIIGLGLGFVIGRLFGGSSRS